jgi:hypothetical protein
MAEEAIRRMQARAHAVRTRAQVRSWQYRQRALAAGVWFRLRRVLADARAAFAISDADAGRLLDEGYRPAESGSQLTPEKRIFFVDEARVTDLPSRRAIPVGLGQDFLTSAAVVLIAFGDRPPEPKPHAPLHAPRSR